MMLLIFTLIINLIILFILLTNPKKNKREKYLTQYRPSRICWIENGMQVCQSKSNFGVEGYTLSSRDARGCGIDEETGLYMCENRPSYIPYKTKNK